MKIYGHDKQLQIIREAAANERLAHAYLFYGMEGIGKRLVALEIARSLLCPVSAPFACGECPSCKKALHGNHPDIFLFALQEAQSIKIDDIRMLQEKAVLRPFEASKKIFIVDNAEAMTREAANALLKTLEEPPPSSIFFLITSRYHLLPSTVLSRCQKIGFTPLAKDVLTSLLVEENGCAHETALTIAALAGGGVSLAKNMLEGDIMTRRASLQGALRGLLLEREKGVFDFVKVLAGNDKQETQKNLSIIESVCRDVVLFQLFGKTADIINRDWLELVEEMARLFSPLAFVNITREIEGASGALRFNVNRNLLLETICHKIIGAWEW